MNRRPLIIVSSGAVAAVVACALTAGAASAGTAPASPSRTAAATAMRQLQARHAPQALQTHQLQSRAELRTLSGSQALTIRRAVTDLHGQGGGSSAWGAASIAPRDVATTTPSAATVSGSSGVISFSATSSAGFVQFAVDQAAFGAPVPADGGTATAQFPSWGYANGAHTMTAIDCVSSDPTTCASTSASAPFTIANTAPTISAPAAGATITGGFTMKATSSGGAVRFLIDGRAVGTDTTTPYSLAYSGSALSTGRHTIGAVQCSESGTLCEGPAAATITIRSDSLHPRIAGVSPRTFSPNRDGVKDATTISYNLPDRESVTVTVRNSFGMLVRGPVSLGSRIGSQAWTWNGVTNAKRTARTGRYTVTIATQATRAGVVVRGLATTAVAVDLTPARLTVLAAPSTIYPVHDGYLDTFVLAATVSEPGVYTVTFSNAKHRAVRTLTVRHGAGHLTMTWNGRDAAGRAVPDGTYTWSVRTQDAVGNIGTLSPRRLVVSPKRLVTRSTVLTRNGDTAFAGGGSASCAGASYADSGYTHGVWLGNACDYSSDGTQIAFASYRFTLPDAARYTRIAVEAGGRTHFAPTGIEAAVFRTDKNKVDIPAFYKITSGQEGLYRLGAVNGANHVSATHQVRVGISVDDFVDSRNDFDLAAVRLNVIYQVLQ